LVRSPSAFSTLFAPGKSWDNVRSTTAPYTESRPTRSVANERVGFPVVEQSGSKLFAKFGPSRIQIQDQLFYDGSRINLE
jgi:hypothetical protein